MKAVEAGRTHLQAAKGFSGFRVEALSAHAKDLCCPTLVVWLYETCTSGIFLLSYSQLSNEAGSTPSILHQAA
jgi:hypothetical protein